MKIHRLKIESNYFSQLVYGLKTFEIRKNDRDYKTGDYLLFRSGTTWHAVRIIGILTAQEFPEGIQPGYCILSLKECHARDIFWAVSEYLKSTEGQEQANHERAQAAVNHVVAMRKEAVK